MYWQASKGKQRHTFYTMPEYEAWKESLGGVTNGWTIKYYKVCLLGYSCLCCALACPVGCSPAAALVDRCPGAMTRYMQVLSAH